MEKVYVIYAYDKDGKRDHQVNVPHIDRKYAEDCCRTYQSCCSKSTGMDYRVVEMDYKEWLDTPFCPNE